MKGVKLAASVPRGISAESGRRLFQALVPLASTPLEVCLAKNHKLPAWAAPKEEREHLTYKGFANTQTLSGHAYKAGHRRFCISSHLRCLCCRCKSESSAVGARIFPEWVQTLAL